MSNSELCNALCSTNIVWINKKNYGDISINSLNRSVKGDRHLSKEKFHFNLLPRLSDRISNSRNSDRAWRPANNQN